MATDAGSASRLQHLIRLEDLRDEQLEDLLDLAARLKARPGRGDLGARSVGLLFFRPSLRTRISFEAAMHQLGGHAIDLSATSDFWQLEDREGRVMDGRAPEHIKDAAAVLSRYVDALAVRPAAEGNAWNVDRKDSQIAAWARYATVPVINMESALWHPLQALADVLTLRERLGSLPGRRLALVWVASQQPASVAVAHSVLLAALRQGMEVRLAHPPGFELDETVLEAARRTARERGTRLVETGDREAAVDGAEIVYARSWKSLEHYGNETLEASHRARFHGWKIDEALLARGADARLMHAMPIRRNLEVTDEVLDGPRSLVYDQAENRLHAQKALLRLLLRA